MTEKFRYMDEKIRRLRIRRIIKEVVRCAKDVVENKMLLL